MFKIFKRRELIKKYEESKKMYSILITKDCTVYCLYGEDYKTAHYKNMKTGEVLKLSDRTDGDPSYLYDYGYIENKKIIELAQKHKIFDWITTPFEDMNDLLYDMFAFIQKREKEWFNTPEMKELTNGYSDFYFIEEQIERLIGDAMEAIYPTVWECYDSDEEESFDLPINVIEELQAFQQEYYLKDLDEAIVFSAIKQFIEKDSENNL